MRTLREREMCGGFVLKWGVGKIDIIESSGQMAAGLLRGISCFDVNTEIYGAANSPCRFTVQYFLSG